MFIENLRQHSKYISAAHANAWTAFLHKPLPSRKDEDWKYTDLTFLNKQNFAVDMSDAVSVRQTSTSPLTLSIGRGSAASRELGSIKGLTICDRATALEKIKSVGALMTAPWSYTNYFSELFDITDTADTYFIFDSQWDPNSVCQLEFVTPTLQSTLSSVGIRVVVLPGANVKLHEVFNGGVENLLNVTLSYFIGENANVTAFKFDSALSGRVMSTLRARIAKNGRLHSVHFTGDASWARHNAYVELAGEGAHAELSASYLGGEGHFVDHHTFMDHKVAHTTSNQEYSGVLAAKAVGVFSGKVWIQRDAQKSNAEQLSRNLLLAKSAEANSKPELLIDADDVKAKHGATIGQMDQEELFYMQSRGLTPSQAREMVLKSFVFASADKLPEALQQIYFAKVGKEIAQFITDLRNV